MRLSKNNFLAYLLSFHFWSLHPEAFTRNTGLLNSFVINYQISLDHGLMTVSSLQKHSIFSILSDPMEQMRKLR